MLGYFNKSTSSVIVKDHPHITETGNVYYNPNLCNFIVFCFFLRKVQLFSSASMNLLVGQTGPGVGSNVVQVLVLSVPLFLSWSRVSQASLLTSQSFMLFCHKKRALIFSPFLTLTIKASMIPRHFSWSFILALLSYLLTVFSLIT